MPLTTKSAIRLAVDIGDEFIKGKEHLSFTIVPVGTPNTLRLRMEFDDEVTFEALERALDHGLGEGALRSEVDRFSAHCRRVFSDTLFALRVRVGKARASAAESDRAAS